MGVGRGVRFGVESGQGFTLPGEQAPVCQTNLFEDRKAEPAPEAVTLGVGQQPVGRFADDDQRIGKGLQFQDAAGAQGGDLLESVVGGGERLGAGGLETCHRPRGEAAQVRLGGEVIAEDD